MKTTDVSVVILTFNEEANLSAALDSVKGWAKEVFVVDSFSTDRTVDIALERASDGVHVVQHAFQDYSAQWNWALQHLPIASPWTLKLDADERVTSEFKNEFEFLGAIAPQEVEGIWFRRRVFFLGKPIRWGIVRGNFDLRMWRTGSVVFEDRPVNEHAIVQGQTVKMSASIDHRDYRSLSEWLDRQHRYTSLEANCLLNDRLTGDVRPRLFGNPNERQIWLRRLYFRIPFRAALFFVYTYLFRLGFLDGSAGFNLALLQSVNLHILDLKVAECRKRSWSSAKVQWPERGQPHPGLPRVDAACRSAVRSCESE